MMLRGAQRRADLRTATSCSSRTRTHPLGSRPDARAVALLDRAMALRAGPYQVRPRCGAHAQADRSEDTDWPQIAALYRERRHQPSPVWSQPGGRRGRPRPRRRSAAHDPARTGTHLTRPPGPTSSAPGPAGRARAAYGVARELATNERERAFLSRRLETVA
jgi:RNA polymerase sigma-70 factor (ECF subfamily)